MVNVESMSPDVSATVQDKAHFLAQPEIAAFCLRLSAWLNGEAIQPHPFQLRDKTLPEGLPRSFSAHCLQACFEHYHWCGLDYTGNQQERQRLYLALTRALAHDDADALLQAVDAALRWSTGGKGIKLYTLNLGWAQANRSRLVAQLRAALAILEADAPDVSAFNDRLRMNVGFTKVYALSSRQLMMYDGRIGAALGLLVRQHCQLLSINLPDALGFPWAPGASSLNRNPSNERYRFRQLANRGAFHAEWMIRASWIVNTAIANANADWLAGDDALRRVEAALFMLGYEIPSEPVRYATHHR